MRVNKPSENIVIRYCLAKDGHGGITCGSETAGGIKNLYLHDCVFDGTRTGFRFKTRRNRGGTVEDIFYENIRIIDAREAFTWDLLGTPMYMGILAQRNPPLDITPLTPTVRNIRIRNFVVESADRLMSINGIPEIPCSGVVVENGWVRTNRIFKSMCDVDGLTFRNVEIQATDNSITIDESKNLLFEDVTLHTPEHSLNIGLVGNATNIRLVNDGKETILKQGVNVLP